MIDWIIHRTIDAVEKRLGVEVDYLRDMARVSRAAFFKFMMFMPLAQHRGTLDALTHHTAGLTATLHQDCGTCVQIAINEALRDGVPMAHLKSVLEGRPDELPAHIQDVYHYVQAVVEQRDDAAEWRRRVRGHVGEEGLVALSLAIAAAQVFSVVKRGMGHDVSCRLIEFDFGDREAAAARHPTDKAA